MCVGPVPGAALALRHVIVRWRRRTMRERRPREFFFPSAPFPPRRAPPRLATPRLAAPRRPYEPLPACANPATTSFHFFSSVPASDCRHSWLPSHRLSSCFPSLRLRFVPLLRALCLSALSPGFSLSLSFPLSSPLPSDVSPFASAAAFPARFARGVPIVSRWSAVVVSIS